MTTDQLNRRMAELDGWTDLQEATVVMGRLYGIPPKGCIVCEGYRLPLTNLYPAPCNYTTSHDAIRPVLEKMTDEELTDVAGKLVTYPLVNMQRTWPELLRATPLELCRAICTVKGER